MSWVVDILVALATGGLSGFFTARYEARAETERIRERTQDQFGEARRAVYREFLYHLDRYGDPRPVAKNEARDTGLTEGEEEDWQSRYLWEHGKLVSVYGKNVMKVVQEHDFS